MRNPLPAGALAALALGVLAAAAVAADGPATLDEALALARQQDKVLVIDFYTDW